MNEKETLIKADIISFLKVIAPLKQSTANPLCCYCTVANGDCSFNTAEFLCVNIDCDKCFLNKFCGTECREETYCCSVFEKWLESEVEE